MNITCRIIKVQNLRPSHVHSDRIQLDFSGQAGHIGSHNGHVDCGIVGQRQVGHHTVVKLADTDEVLELCAARNST